MNNVDTLLVSRSGDVLVVGRKRAGEAIDIVNAFSGKEAEELYKRLIEKNKAGSIGDS